MKFQRQLLLAIIICSLFAAYAPAQAEKIYQWVDETGVTHYSDTPKDSSATPVQLTKGLATPAAPKEDTVNSGTEIWQNLCSKCHHTGLKFNEEGLRGLPETMIKPVLPVDKLIKRIEEAIYNVDKMADIKLNEDELHSLAEEITRFAKQL